MGARQDRIQRGILILLRRGDEAAVLAPGQRRAQKFAARAVGFQIGPGDGGFEPGARQIRRTARGSAVSGTVRRRPPPRPDCPAGPALCVCADVAVDQRLARLHVDLPEFQRHAFRRQGAAHKIAVADRGAADGDENVDASSMRRGSRPRWLRAGRGRRRGRSPPRPGRDQAEHRIGVGGDDLVRPALFAGRGQFVAGRQHGNFRSAAHREGWDGRRRRRGRRRRGKAAARVQNGSRPRGSRRRRRARSCPASPPPAR